MVHSKESDKKPEGFLDHGPSFFKNRLKRSNDTEAHNRVATQADPYSHVDSNRSKVSDAAKTYSNPVEVALVDEAEGLVSSYRQVYSDGPFEEAYSLLRKYGAVQFLAEREDGTWEVQNLLEPQA